MALNIDQNIGTKTDFGRIEDGSYTARVAQVIDLGQQHNTIWVNGQSLPEYYVVDGEGKTEKNSEGYAKKTTKDTGHPVIMPKVQINYEFPTERIEINGEDKPRFQGKEYNVTSKGALAKLVAALAPGSSSVGSVVGEPCTVQIGSTASGNAKVVSVGPPMKGMTVPELENPPVVFDFDEPDMTVWENIPNWIKDKIKEATNYSGSKLSKLVEGADSQAQAAQEATNFSDFDADEDIPY